MRKSNDFAWAATRRKMSQSAKRRIARKRSAQTILSAAHA